MAKPFTTPTTVDGTRNADLGKQNYQNAAFDKYGQPFYIARQSIWLTSQYEQDFLDMKATVADGDMGINVVVTNNGSVTSANSATYPGGVLAVAASDTSVADNDEAYISSEALNWTLAANKTLYFEAAFTLTEASTDDANLIVGLMDTGAADSLQDNGGGPPDDYNGIVWFKVDGGTVFQFETAKSTSHNTTASAGAFTSATKYRVGFLCEGVTKVTPYLDGVAGTALTTVAGIPDGVALGWTIGVKNGDTNAEIIYPDYVRVVQLR